MSAPIEVKVSAATVAGAVSAFLAWVLRTYVFDGDLPLPVDGLLQILVPVIVTFLAGYFAPHTPRPDLEAPTGSHVADGEPHDLSVTDLRDRLNP